VNRGRVYLAGPIGGKTYGEATDWREELTQRLAAVGIEALSPMRGKKYLSRMETMPYATPSSASPLTTPRGINTRDRWDAARCDVLLVNLLGATKPSFGTVLEIGYAVGADPLKPIILVMEADNLHRHAMVLDNAGYVVETLAEAEMIVCSLLNAGGGVS
jgi:nucleoside 2-deoxyribosyltransferase